MNDIKLPTIPKRYLERIELLLKDGQRKILGLVGAPGAGKSTLADALMKTFSEAAQVVPMDGFHLANTELERLSLSANKGAPDTFDSAGYVDLLHRLRQQGKNEIVYAPEFRREIEEPIAGAIPVFSCTQLIITEGNYLLLDHGHWSRVASLLDDIWFVDVDDALRIQRLTQRHQQYGRELEQARQWVNTTDEPNARLVEQTQQRAHLHFNWDESPVHAERP